MKERGTYMVMFGGGIGECQSTRTCNTPLQAIKQWVRGQNPNGRYTAPMDTWITAPSVGWDLELDINEVRNFYQWIIDNPERLGAELEKQDVYRILLFIERACDYARTFLAMTDDEIASKFENESLSPFTGG